MIEPAFYGFASHPGNILGECLDAAGVDASVGHRVAAGIDALETGCNNAPAGGELCPVGIQQESAASRYSHRSRSRAA